jgi:hypothetical protein
MKILIRYISLVSVIVFISSAKLTFSQNYVLIGWNDLGMHCANKDFSKIAVLPPYNNVRAQLIKRGQLGPQTVTTGYTVEYSIPGNTYSAGKTNFWTYAQALFGLSQPLPQDVGLTGNGLTGQMVIEGNNFRATGIPVTPFQDNDLINEKPYQLIHLVAKAVNSSEILAYTDVVIPVSNEISCVSSGCHTSQDQILSQHESVTGFNKTGPVLCANCHASNALGTIGKAEAKSLSFRIHDQHKDLLAQNSIETCYKCHPGQKTKCFRDVMRNGKTKQMICQDCHGTMSQVASSITTGRRPWLDEPKCGTCHGTKYAEETGKLFRESKGHGGLFCSACHGSPHAILPTSEANDNLQNIRLQGFAGILQKCSVCHREPILRGTGPHGKILLVQINPGILVEKISGITDNLSFKLDQNYPNPFNPSTSINYQLPVPGDVLIRVYNNAGQEVQILVNGPQEAGTYRVQFDGRNLASGIYFYQIKAGTFIQTKKMLLIK